MSEKRPIKPKVYARAIVAIALIIVWVGSAFSGIILWLAPEVRRAGRQALLFGITKENWRDIHFLDLCRRCGCYHSAYNH